MGRRPGQMAVQSTENRLQSHSGWKRRGRALARLARLVHRHYIAVLVASVALSLVGTDLALRLAVVTDFSRLLPQSDVSVRELNRIKTRVGGIGPLSIIVTGEDLQQAARFLEALADTLEKHPMVGSVVRGKNPEFFARNYLLYMDEQDLASVRQRLEDFSDRERVRRSPLYVPLGEEDEEGLDFSDLKAKYDRRAASRLERDYYVTAEGNGLVLRVYPTGVITDVDFSRRLLAALDGVVASVDPSRFGPTIHCLYKGSFKNTLYQYDVIMGDLKATALLSVGGVLLLIVLFFRQVLGALFVALPLFMSLTWTFGLTEMVIGSLNQITVGLFAILFGLGIDFGIHVFARYREARRGGRDVGAAMEETLVGTGGALISTALTTSLAFYSLGLTEFKGFTQLGFIVGTGILFALISMLFTCPALIVAAERLGMLRVGRTGAGATAGPRQGPYPWPRVSLAAAAVVTAYGIWHLWDLRFEYDFSKLRPDAPNAEEQQTLPRSLRDLESPAIVLTETPQEAQAVVQAVQREQRARGAQSTVRTVRSVYSLLPKNQLAKLETIERIRLLADRCAAWANPAQLARLDSLRPLLDVRALRLSDLPRDLTRSFTDRDGDILNFVAIYAAVPLRDGRQAMAFEREVGSIRTASGAVYHASSAHIIFARMLQLMLRESTVALGITLLVVAVILAVDLRRLGDAVLALSPLLMALLWTAGAMYAFDIRLNMYNVVVFPTMVGMGVDNSIHIYHRYREAGTGSLRFVLRTTGMALVATTLTTMVGFAGLLAGHHPALRSIGTLSLIGLLSSFLAATTVLPALLQVRENRRRGGTRKPDSSSVTTVTPEALP